MENLNIKQFNEIVTGGTYFSGNGFDICEHEGKFIQTILLYFQTYLINYPVLLFTFFKYLKQATFIARKIFTRV